MHTDRRQSGVVYLMAVLFSLDQEGATWQVKVVNCISGTVFNVNDILNQKIVFYKPDGTRFEKDAVLVVDTQNPTESFIQYQNTNEPSILDLIGSWQFTGEIELLTTDTVQLSQRAQFWVK